MWKVGRSVHELCAALRTHNCVRQCALTIVCGIVNCARHYYYYKAGHNEAHDHVFMNIRKYLSTGSILQNILKFFSGILIPASKFLFNSDGMTKSTLLLWETEINIDWLHFNFLPLWSILSVIITALYIQDCGGTEGTELKANFGHWKGHFYSSST